MSASSSIERAGGGLRGHATGERLDGAQRALLAHGGQMQIDCGRLDGRVAEVGTEESQTDARFEQMRGVGAEPPGGERDRLPEAGP